MKLLLENWRKYIKEQSVLEEGITDIVFHKTQVKNAGKILNSDKFMTSAAFADDKDLEDNKKKLYYFSTMRSPQGQYVPAGNTVTFQLDGRMLGQNFKAAPVDYFKNQDNAPDEMEDRILTDKPFISPASKYISAIHFGIPVKEDDMLEEAELNAAKAAVQMGKKNDFPVHFYLTEKDYEILNKTKRFDFEKWYKAFKDAGGDSVDMDDDDLDQDGDLNMDQDLQKLAQTIKAIQSGNLESIDSEIKAKILSMPLEELTKYIQLKVVLAKASPSAREDITLIGSGIKKLKGASGLAQWMKVSLSSEPQQAAAE